MIQRGSPLPVMWPIGDRGPAVTHHLYRVHGVYMRGKLCGWVFVFGGKRELDEPRCIRLGANH